MGYQVQIEGGRSGGGKSELFQVREAISKAIAELQDAGHQISTTFIKHPSLTTPRDEAHNFQDPNERARYQGEADDWNGVMQEAREDSQRMSSRTAQQANQDVPGQEPVLPDRTESSSPVPGAPPAPTSSSVGAPQTRTVTNPSPAPADKPAPPKP